MKHIQFKMYITVFLLFISFHAHTFELEYKWIYMDIPDSEVAGVGVTVDIPGTTSSLFLYAKGWHIGFSNGIFSKDCALVSKYAPNLACNEQARIKELDRLIAEKTSVPAVILFSNHDHEEIRRQEYKDYILYSSASSNKYSAALFSVAFLVEKKTGRTIDLAGKFSDKHLEWLRLEPLESME